MNEKLEGIRDGKMVSFSQFSEIKLPYPSIQEQEKIAGFLTAVDELIADLTKKESLLQKYKKGVMQKIFSQELRFKQDDGSDFPEWEEKKLGEVCEIVGGGTPDTNNNLYWSGNIQWFTPTEIKNKYVFSSQRTITQLGLKNSSAKILPKGTVLFTSRATIGEVSISNQECSTNQGFQSFIATEYISNQFLYYWILCNKDIFIKKASGSTFLEISKREISNTIICMASKEEQEKIASFLTAIDDQITTIQQQLEKTKQYKKSLLQQLFI